MFHVLPFKVFTKGCMFHVLPFKVFTKGCMFQGVPFKVFTKGCMFQGVPFKVFTKGCMFQGVPCLPAHCCTDCRNWLRERRRQSWAETWPCIPSQCPLLPQLHCAAACICSPFLLETERKKRELNEGKRNDADRLWLGRPAEGSTLGPSPWVDGGCVVSQGATVVLMGVSECEGWVVSATVVLLGVSEGEGWVVSSTVGLMGVCVAVGVRDGRWVLQWC